MLRFAACEMFSGGDGDWDRFSGLRLLLLLFVSQQGCFYYRAVTVLYVVHVEGQLITECTEKQTDNIFLHDDAVAIK